MVDSITIYVDQIVKILFVLTSNNITRTVWIGECIQETDILFI
jgi:hypothetical protein